MRAIFLRELGALCRRPTLAFILTLLLLSIITFVSGTWPTPDRVNPDEIAARGIELFHDASFIELAFLLLLAPAVAAPALIDERRAGTLTLLLMSGHPPWAILAAKLGARLLLIGLAALLPFPVFLAVSSLGGTSFESVIFVTATLLAAAALSIALGLFFSCILEEAHRAVLASHALLAIPLILPFALPAFGLAPNILLTGFHGPWEAYASPAANINAILNPGSFGLDHIRGAWVQPLLALLTSALLFWASALLLERAAQPRTPSRPGLFGRLLGRLRSFELAPAQLGKNPIYWRETEVHGLHRLGALHRISTAAWLGLAALLILDAAPATRPILEDLCTRLPGTAAPELKVHGALAGLLLGLVALAATVAAASSVARERQSGLLTLLAVTPLDFRTFLWGKSLGLARNLAPLLLLPYAFLVALALQLRLPWTAVPLLAAAVPITALFTITQGIYCALSTTSTTRALVTALALLGVQAFFPICCLLSFNPLTLGYSMFTIHDAANQSRDRLNLTIQTIISFAIHLAALLLLARTLHASFDRFLGRTGALELPFEQRLSA